MFLRFIDRIFIYFNQGAWNLQKSSNNLLFLTNYFLTLRCLGNGGGCAILKVCSLPYQPRYCKLTLLKKLPNKLTINFARILNHQLQFPVPLTQHLRRHDF